MEVKVKLKLSNLLQKTYFTSVDDAKQYWTEYTCKDSSLGNKAKVLLVKLNKLYTNDVKKLFGKDSEVSFKNIKSTGNSYDVIVVNSGNNVFEITHKNSENGMSELSINGNLVVSGSWIDVVNYFRK
jgi:hypothetical protein